MLRIPGTLNYSCFIKDGRGKVIDIPYESQVRIVDTPVVSNLLITHYYNWLQFRAIGNIWKQNIREQNKKCYGKTIDIIYLHKKGDIDRLFENPISDHRWLCICR